MPHAGPLWVLLVGRLLSGVSAGVVAGAATAAVIEAAPESWRITDEASDHGPLSASARHRR